VSLRATFHLEVPVCGSSRPGLLDAEVRLGKAEVGSTTVPLAPSGAKDQNGQKYTNLSIKCAPSRI
jgi:hypothetical protein